MTIRVVLAENKPERLDGPKSHFPMRPILDAEEGIHVVGEGDGAAETLRLVLRHRPDVLIVDFHLPSANGLQLTRNLRDLNIHTPVILLMEGQEDREDREEQEDQEEQDVSLVRRALRAGVRACIVRERAAEELSLAIRVAFREHEREWEHHREREASERHRAGSGTIHRQRGRTGAMARSVAQSYVMHLDPLQRLSPRERQILQFLAEGHSTTTIARRLTLPLKTVQTYQAALLLKLSRQDRPDRGGFGPVAMSRGAACPNG
jgi:DNA-binding NarL/FixJ family response regulator